MSAAKADTPWAGLVFLETTSPRTWGFSGTLNEGWEFGMEGKREGLATVLIVPPSEPGKSQYELARGGEDPDFNSHIDLE